MNITVIPHKLGSIKTFHFKKVFIYTASIILFFLILILSLPLILRTISPDSFSTHSLISKNRELELSLQEFNKQYDEIREKYTSIRENGEIIQSSFAPLRKDPGLRHKKRKDINSVLKDLERISYKFERIEKELIKDRNRASHIPSILPVKGFITKTFGYIRDEFSGQRKFCEGINITVPIETKVIATGAGIVKFAGFKQHYGLMVVIDHGYDLSTSYSHLKLIKTGRGQRVKRGDIIGLVGTTGKTVGPCLHYEVRLNGKPQNPIDYILEEVEYF